MNIRASTHLVLLLRLNHEEQALYLLNEALSNTTTVVSSHT